MSHRINNLLTHITVRPTDTEELQHLKQRLAQASLANQFIPSLEHLQKMSLYMMLEMIEGLNGRPSTVVMLPTFVFKSHSSTATGTYYAMDLGGTNFRVLRLELQHGHITKRDHSTTLIPKVARRGDQRDLFGFMAKCLKKMMIEKASEDLEKRIPIGFTFSFPCNQKKVNSGTLIIFGKHFTTKNVVGKDVVELLQAAIRRESLKAEVVALCNDTVGTLIARYFEDENCQVSAIIGTGANTAYFERSDAVTKQPDVAAHGALMTPINMECGNFDSTHKYVLPITPFDEAMDAITPNFKAQRMEKLVSGMYLGEISRQVLVKLAQIGCLPTELVDGLSKPWGFETRHMGMVCADQMPGLQFTRNLVKQVTGVDMCDMSDLHVFREVCRLVRNRSACLSSVLCCAPILKNHTQGLASVAVDGSVYEKTPSFQRLYQESITRLLGKESNVKVNLQKDGSGVGAAMISALVVHQVV